MDVLAGFGARPYIGAPSSQWFAPSAGYNRSLLLRNNWDLFAEMIMLYICFGNRFSCLFANVLLSHLTLCCFSTNLFLGCLGLFSSSGTSRFLSEHVRAGSCSHGSVAEICLLDVTHFFAWGSVNTLYPWLFTSQAPMTLH